MIEMQFLGTSAGIPSKSRNVTGLVLRLLPLKDQILVDCGEASQHQLMRSSFAITRIKHIFITHMHGDHTLGLPGLLASRSLLGSKEPVTVTGPAGIQKFVQDSLDATFCNLDFELKFNEIAKGIDFSTQIPGFKVSSISLKHNIPSYAYRFEQSKPHRTFLVEKAKSLGIPEGHLYKDLQLGKTITLEDGRSFHGEDFLSKPKKPLVLIVGGDNVNPSLVSPFLEHADVFVHEATYTHSDFEKLPRKLFHSTVEQVAKVAQEAKVKNLVLTHFSPRYHDPRLDAFPSIEALAKEHFDGQLFLAEDLAKFELGKPGDALVRTN